MGINQAKIEKILICQAILLGFLCSLVSTILYEANKSNQQHKEKPSCAVEMFRNLLQHARCLAQHVAVANARAKVRAQMHNWSIS